MGTQTTTICVVFCLLCRFVCWLICAVACCLFIICLSLSVFPLYKTLSVKQWVASYISVCFTGNPSNVVYFNFSLLSVIWRIKYYCNSSISTYELTALEREMNTPPTPLWVMAQFTFWPSTSARRVLRIVRLPLKFSWNWFRWNYLELSTAQNFK